MMVFDKKIYFHKCGPSAVEMIKLLNENYCDYVSIICTLRTDSECEAVRVGHRRPLGHSAGNSRRNCGKHHVLPRHLPGNKCVHVKVR